MLLPFNAPGYSAVKKAAFALAAGCPVVLKPAPSAPHGPNLVAQALHGIIAKSGLPGSLVQLVHGGADVAQQLARDRRVGCVAFTGSRTGGRAVAAAAGQALVPMQLESGSNNPVVVCDDADVDATAAALVSGATTLNGQWCERPATVLVARSHHDALRDALCDRLRAQRVGSRRADGVELGPQGNHRQATAYDAAITRLRRLGGVVETPAAVDPGAGYLRAASLCTGLAPQDVVDEIFGPALTLHPVADDDEAVAASYRLESGLAGYVFTEDLDRGHQVGVRLPAGEVRINDTGLGDLDPNSEQGFWHGSGIGSHGDHLLLEFFAGARIVGGVAP